MFKKVKTPTHLDLEIERVLSELEAHAADSKEYKDILDSYERLMKLVPRQDPLFSGDAMLGAFANLLGIGAVLGYEKFNVITSKAFGWIKPRSIGKL